MKLKTLILAAGMLLCGGALAGAELQSLQEKRQLKTQVMVFGSAHLKTIKEEIAPESLSPVLQILAHYGPTAIAVESLRPADIVFMTQNASDYQPVLDQFVGSTFIALAQAEQQALNLSPQEAIARLRSLLKADITSSSQRVTVIRTAIAGYNLPTALLHWDYLDGDKARDTLPEAIAQYLSEKAGQNNETSLIAAELARTLGLNQLYPIDDHLDKDLYPEVVSQLMDSYQRSEAAKQFANSEYVKKPERLKAQALESGNWLPLFQWMNSEDYNAEVLSQEWSLFVDKDLDPAPAMARMALWEIRNLNMASNINRVIAEHIGGRVMVVVGGSHKVFLERYLANMIGVELVQFNALVEDSESR